MSIHETAVIEDGAKVGKNVTIEPYVVIKSNVTIEDNVHIKSHVYIDGNTTVGEGTVVYPFACIGTKAQNLNYRGEKTFVKIGKNCEIREYVTINSSSQENSVVSLGDNCFIMAYCHIAHNCELGNNVIMSNGAQLAGHVIIEDHAIVGGMTAVHQHVRIGAYSMVGGMSGLPCDVPPYTIGAGRPFRFGGLNMVGLKRHGFSLETRSELTRAFKLVYRQGLHLDEALRRIEEELKPLPEIQHWLSFCKNSKRGLVALKETECSPSECTLVEEEENLAVAEVCT
jgi:UDP-N-acetylglucosamine acyltransferase